MSTFYILKTILFGHNQPLTSLNNRSLLLGPLVPKKVENAIHKNKHIFYWNCLEGFRLFLDLLECFAFLKWTDATLWQTWRPLVPT